MGTFNFQWSHPAEEVYVTGTFDNWSKSEKLQKIGGLFEKEVTLPDASEKIYYKFVVDGDWTVDYSAPKENDASGNENNVLTPDRIVKEPPTAAIMNSAAPHSTTAELAKDAPLEKREEPSDGLPGTFPETPALDVSVNPMPAAEGAVNPIKLEPGEKVPESITTQSRVTNVKLDKESYEKSDALPGTSTELPPVSPNMIPESSLPIADAHAAAIISAAPDSSTAALAADAPLEPNVPATVKESQDKAGFDPEASGLSEAVEEKGQVENELLKKVPEAPTTSEGTAGKGTDKSENDKTLAETATATVVAAGAAALAGAVIAKDTIVDKSTEAATQLPDSVKEQLPVSAQEAIAASSKEETREEVSPEVPTAVKESIKDADKDPEAAANTSAVEEKKVVEAQLLKEVKPTAAAAGDPEPEPSKKEEVKEEVKAAVKPNGTESASEPTAAPASESTEATKVPETPSTPTTPKNGAAKNDAASVSGETSGKKKNRLSRLFGKLKPKGH